MPKPNPGESKKDYIGRFMKSGEAQTDFPDEKQRLAVAYSMFEKKNSIAAYGKEYPWPKQYSCTFIEPGVVFYQDLGECKVCGDKFTCGSEADGTSKCQITGETILVKQEALAKMAKSFIGKPVIDQKHEDVRASTVADGEADGIVTDVWLDDKSGWWMAKFLVWDMATQQHCESLAYSVSCAYEPTDVNEQGGEYHNIPYASEILDGDYTHLAIVTNPRYEGARILLNSKGGIMSWKFWEKGARENAAPLDPLKEKINVDGADVPLQELYDSLEEEKPKYNDDTILETPKGAKTLGELKQAYRNKLKKNTEGEAIKTSAPADAGAGSHEESSKGSFEHAGACDHCKHPAFNADDAKAADGKKLPDLRAAAGSEGDPEAAAKKLDAETKEKQALELKQAEDKKAEEEKKNAEDKAKEEMRQAEEKAAAEKELANSKKEAGRKAFADLKNARTELVGDAVKINPVSLPERLAVGSKKYGSA